MYIDLEPIFQQEGVSVPIDHTFSSEDEVIASPVRLRGRVYNKTGIVRMDVTASYTGEAACARCNKRFTFQTEVPVEHILLPHDGNGADDDLYIVVDDMRLDPDALAEEDIVLAMPSRYLCREDCKGLCPVCGADLNAGDCGCRPPTDPRWDALKDLI